EAEDGIRAFHVTGIQTCALPIFHSLCTELLRAHPAEAGIDPRFAMLEEADSTILKNHAVEAALAMAADDPLLVRLFQLFGERGLDRKSVVEGKTGDLSTGRTTK